MAKLTLETAVANGFHWKKCAMKNINYNYSKYLSSRVYVGIQLEKVVALDFAWRDTCERNCWAFDIFKKSDTSLP